MTICPIGFATSGQTSCRELREPVAADDDPDVLRGFCIVVHSHRLSMVYEYGIGILHDEPFGTMNGVMAEEKGDGRLTSVIVLCTSCAADLVTPFTWLSYASHVQNVCQPMQTIINGGNRARCRALSLAMQVVSRMTICHRSAAIVSHKAHPHTKS